MPFIACSDESAVVKMPSSLSWKNWLEVAGLLAFVPNAEVTTVVVPPSPIGLFTPTEGRPTLLPGLLLFVLPW